MSGQWQTNSAPSSGTKALATVSAGTTGGEALRCRGMEAVLAGETTGISTATVTVIDGLSGGTVILSAPLSAPAKATVALSLTNLDLRATSGNLSVKITAPVAGTASVNAQGDYVQLGKNYGDG